MIKKESGFGIVEVSIGLIIAILVIALGLYGWHNSQQSRQAQTSAQPKTSTPKSALSSGAANDPAMFLTDQEKTAVPANWQITDWHIAASNNGSATLQYKEDDNKKRISFTSAELVANTPVCNIFKQAGGYNGIAWIARYTATETAGGDGVTAVPQSAKDMAAYFDAHGYKDRYKKVGDYYYFFGAPQESCGTGQGATAATDGLVVKTQQAVKDLLTSFSASN